MERFKLFDSTTRMYASKRAHENSTGLDWWISDVNKAYAFTEDEYQDDLVPWPYLANGTIKRIPVELVQPEYDLIRLLGVEVKRK